MSHKVSLIFACTIEGGVGYKNQLPWNILKEMKKFKSITTSVEKKGMINAVIMGRDTWESLKKTPLANRINIILTKNKYHNLNPDNYNNVIIAHSIIDAIIHCSFNDNINNIFIIGGAQIYNIFLRSEYYLK